MEIKLNDVNLELKESGIYSFLGSSKSIKSLLFDELVNRLNTQKIGFVSKNISYNNIKIRKLLSDTLKINNYKLKYANKRIRDALKLVDLDQSYLELNFNDLNYIESKKIMLATALIHNPKILILEDYTDLLNYNDKKELKRMFRILKNRFKKIIIMLTKDTTFSYEISDYFYFLSDKEIVCNGNKSIMYNDKLLKKLNLEVPPIIKFILECRKNNHDINDYNNILDLIKAIYREIY